MPNPFAARGPRTIAGQIVLLVMVSVALFHLATLAALRLAGDAGERVGPVPPALVDRFAEFVRLLDRLPPERRPEVAAAIGQTYPDIALVLHRPGDGPAGAPLPVAPGGPDPFGFLKGALGPGLVPLATGERSGTAERRGVVVRLGDGWAASGTVPDFSGLPRRPEPWVVLVGTLAFVSVILTSLLWWATRGLTAPLARVAASAEAFSLDEDPAPLPEDGPTEMRATARALNRMQARLRHLVADRTRMLAAVGHDLRTPITRLRLRAEFIEEPEVREPLLRDLTQMAALVDAALAHLRGGARAERTLVDLASLLQTLCHDFADMGAAVAYEGPGHLLARAQVEEVQRAVTNLVDNALKHGGRAVTVRLLPSGPGSAAIEVDDDGPGIPDERKAAMLEPFARGDAARTLDDAAGFGLGLAIARSAAEAHGGRLTLHDLRPGLRARLSLRLEAREAG